jgi:hypothetical protein
MRTSVGIEGQIARLKFIKSHTAKCQRENGIKHYAVLKRKTCACPY